MSFITFPHSSLIIETGKKDRYSILALMQKKKTQPLISTSVPDYIKGHFNYKDFNSKEFLEVLNYASPETAKSEAINQLNLMLDMKNLKTEVKSFVSASLMDDLKCVSDADAKLY